MERKKNMNVLEGNVLKAQEEVVKAKKVYYERTAKLENLLKRRCSEEKEKK